MDFKKAKELAEKEAAAFVGQPKVKCPLSKSCLMVLVYKEDTKQILSGARVQVSGKVAGKQGSAGPIFQGKNTDGKGVAKFTPWDPGDYQVEVTLPSADGYEKPEIAHQSVSKGKCPVCCIAVKPLPKLKVKVVQRGDHSRVFNDAVVKIVTAPQQHPDGKTKVGISDFGRTKSGKYEVQVTSLSEEDRKEFAVPKEKVEETLSSGDDKTVIIEVEKLNFVTPKIEMEYKVVVLERKLYQYQKNTEEKIFADPTYIQLSYTQTNSRFSFSKGGKVKFTGVGNVEVYLDEKCKNKLRGDPAAGLQLKPEQLGALTGVKLYLRGIKAGLFDVSLELDDPENDLIRRKDNPAKEPMGVVELKMKVHQHDIEEVKKIQVDPDVAIMGVYHNNLKNAVLPAQAALSDENKVKVGRFIHVQSDSNSDRARLIIEKLEASQWPAGTDDYYIVIDETNVSGGMKIYEKEWDDDPDTSTLKPMPVKLKVSVLKAAEKELWAQGSSATKNWREVKLDLGLDRDEGGLAKTPKHNGDWARFTVVQIKEVKVDYTKEAGKAEAWNEGEKRFYINFKNDPDGRKITIGAQLTEKIQGVSVHFMLAPDKDNMKQANWGIDLPSTWKWKDISADLKHLDKDDRKRLLHFSAKTNADGYAKKELTLSRFGGDKFHPAAYIDQDPHLSKYVDGHRVLEKKKPVFAKDHPIQVWRKFWYQEVKVEGISVSNVSGAIAKFEHFKIVMEAATDVDVTRTDITGINPKVIYPKYMVGYANDNSDALVIGDGNVNTFFAKATAEADKPVKIPIIVCTAYWVPDGDSGAMQSSQTLSTSFPISLVADKKCLKPPLQGGALLVSGTWESARWDPTANANAGDWIDVRNGNLSDADLSIDPARGGGNGRNTIKVSLPAAAGAADASRYVWIDNLVVQAARSYLGTYFPDKKYISAVDNTDADYFLHTVVHEFGHAFHQINTAPVGNIPNHPHHYSLNGNHCSYQTDKCLMYGIVPPSGGGSLRQFCPKCHPYLLVEDISKLY